jgi:branched-subunit amino acid aminotransferase/4-amino-4-deoxychorismate lyase
MTEEATYLNGDWIRLRDLLVPASDLGFVLGATVSERLRTFGGKVFRLTEHLDRLCHSLSIVGLDHAVICAEVQDVLPEVARRGGASVAEGDDVGIVVFVTPPSYPEGDVERAYGMLAIYAVPLAFGEWAHKYQSGERVVLSDVRQVPPTCWPTELKCRSRMHYYLADRQARVRDPGARALVLDQQGRLAEASTANILLVRGGRIFSPLVDYILPGVSLGFLRELARDERIPFEFDELLPRDLPLADEILLASTSPCLLPVCQCDARPVGSGAPGPMFDQLITAWGRSVGVDIRRQAERFADR